MQPDLLQQLRDIHLPADPSWWPPAPGWWLLALAMLAAALWGVGMLRQAVLRRRPIREARALYAKLYGDYRKGLVDATDYLHQANELLKRLFIHGLHLDEARPANDAAWLELLDSGSRTSGFSRGPGRQLGNQRFRPEPDADPEQLHREIETLLRRVRP